LTAAIPRALVAGLIVVAFANAAPGQQRPLQTEDPRVIPEGELALENGLGYLANARFPVSGLGGDQLAILTGGLHVGVGRAQFQMWGSLRNVLWIDEGGDGRTSDWGDGTMAAKFAIAAEAGRRPDVSFQMAVVLPNASNESGLGKDGTDFYGNVLVGHTLGAGYVHGKVGLGILDDAERVGAQQDVLAWGLAGAFPVAAGWSLAAEVAGILNATRNPTRGGEDRGEARLGARWRMLGMEWDAAATAGLTDTDHDVGVVFGTTARFDLW
jgi:hypothetical protein